APVVLGLREHRLDHRLSSSVEPAAIVALEHIAHRCVAPTLPTRPGRLALAGVRWDQHLDMLVLDDVVDLLLVPVARVGDRDARSLCNTNRLEFPLRRLDHRLEGPDAGRAWAS